MNITVERQSNCEAKLHVEIPAEPVREERKRIVQAFSRQARIPGFRPGRVPRTVIEKRYAEAIAAELESRLIRQAYQEAAEKEDLRIIDIKPPEDTTLHPDGSLTFSSILTISPDFELPDYRNLVLRIPDLAIDEEDIAGELEQLRNRFADYHDIDDRPLQSGDFAIIDFTSDIDGTPLEEAVGQSVGYLAGGEGYWLQMEDGSLLPGFAAALEGAAIGENREFTLTVPEDFAVEELRGVEIAFHVTLDAIKEQLLPDLDDELAAEIVPGSTLKGLRETIHGNLERRLNEQIQEYKLNQLLEQLAGMVRFELPPGMVTAETQGQADSLVEQGMSSGMSEEEIEARQEEIFALANRRAQVSLRTDFVLQRIAEAEEIEVSDEELANRVAALANRAKKPIRSFAQELQKSGRLHRIRHSLLVSKTIDFLLENAKLEITDELPAAAGPPPEAADPEDEIVDPIDPATAANEEPSQSAREDE